jgi:chromate transport protein ChrA
LLIQSTATDWTTAAVVVAAAVLFLFSKLHPMAILAAAALAGAAGLVG